MDQSLALLLTGFLTAPSLSQVFSGFLPSLKGTSENVNVLFILSLVRDDMNGSS